jgi:2C-methyl-D-erythritol 2,4-cyclodiphosphate synthase
MATTELRRRQESERRDALAQLIELDAHRRCVAHSHIDAVYALTDAIDGLTRARDRHAAAALEEGESYAEVARGSRLTRQGARKRYGHLEVVS